MSTIYIVVGHVQYDEESATWNARAFEREADAKAYIPGLEERVYEYLPKLQSYLTEVFGNDRQASVIRSSTTDWDTYQVKCDKRKAAEERFRLRVGDAGYAGFHEPARRGILNSTAGGFLMRKPVIPPISAFWYGMSTGFIFAHIVVLLEAVALHFLPWFHLVVDRQVSLLGVLGLVTLWKMANDNARYDMVGRSGR
jgi:hypothetical protein